MGSAQSSTVQSSSSEAAPPAAVDNSGNAGVPSTLSSPHNIRNEQRDAKKKKKKKQNDDKASQLTGFDLVQYRCRRKKKKYDVCYRKWYGSTFTVGQLDKDARENCDDLFEAYQNCILMGMKEDRDRRGLGKASEESYIGTFEAELDYDKEEED